jgi:hypothetical protein
MRMAFAEIIKSLRRFSTILATLLTGVAFVFATGANAVAGDKKVEIKKPEKIEKLEGLDSSRAFNRNVDFNRNFNRNVNFNRNEVFNRNVNFNRNNFNPFFRPFAVDDELFFVNRFEED